MKAGDGSSSEAALADALGVASVATNAKAKAKAKSATQASRRIEMFSHLEETRQKPGLSGHRGAIVGIGEEHALFGGETLREHRDVADGTGQRSNPCCVNERERNHLGKNRRIVRMPHEAERTAGNDAEAR